MFKKFTDGASKQIEIAKWKADQLVRINKVQGEINKLKGEVNGIHEQIAHAVLEMRKQGQALPPELEAVCANLDALQAQISEHETQLAAINAEQAPGSQPAPAVVPAPAAPAASPTGATKACPNCHASVPFAAGFCPNCGFKFAPVEPQKTTVTCPSCSYEVPAGSAFCPNCGTRVTG